jgi:DNA invertase Pin-like site-specific DNA recombinase
MRREMTEAFAIYCRASEEGADGLSSDPAEQEAHARAWADQHDGVYIAEVVTEIASGALDADDRKLGALIARCESGELAGIIVRDEKRFARDVVAGGAALARLTDCGARLVATWTGFDSKNLTPEGLMVFNLMMSVGQAERERNRLRRILGKEKAAASGVCCCSPPVGYDRDGEGRLVPNEDADVIREIFRRRARGEGFSDIAASLPEVTVTVTKDRKRVAKSLTRSGVRQVVRNRAYVGEQRVPVKDRRGEPKVHRDNHRPIVTETEWDAANAVMGRAPIRRGLGEQAQLKGIVRCGTCGATMHVLAYGKPREKLTYACTRTGCGAASMSVPKVEAAVLWQLDLAIVNGVPEVAAVIEGDTRYSDALTAVEEAQRTLDEYRDSLELQRALGISDFAAGLAVRREAVATARRALQDVPRPDESPDGNCEMTLADFDREDQRRFYRRVIAEVLVFPRSAKQRATVRWVGSDTLTPAPLVQGSIIPTAANEAA